MARKRIHELAREWGVETKQILAKLEEKGIRSKKASSSLSDEEQELIRREEPASADNPAVVVGKEKVVEERVVADADPRVTVREEVRETRVSSGVIRRRTSAHKEESPAAELSFAEGESLAAPLAEPFVVPLPLPFDPSVAEPTPLAPPVSPEANFPPAVESESVASLLQPEEIETAPPLVPVDEVVEEVKVPPDTTLESVPTPHFHQPESHTQTKAAAPVRPAAALLPTGETGMPRPRILGRIDLAKVSPEPKPRPEVRAKPSTPAGHARSGGAPAVGGDGGREVPPAGAAQRRPKKRKVVHKAELLEAQERDIRATRPGKKRRVPLMKDQRQTEITVPKASKRVIRISEVITVGDLARQLGIKSGEVIKKLMGLGVLATINQVLDADTAGVVAGEFEYTVENVAFDVDSVLETGHEVEEGNGDLEARPPVVTIMGHVDHGKTSLLDAIRKTNVTAQEHGGITQHVGAYSAQINGRSVTFLDTPGHEAFTAMRARGAKVTDLVTLVVAADDGVMPQTVEAINHARAASVPMIIAVNKIDRPGADPERVTRQLMNHGLVSESLGGDTIFVHVSAKTGEGIPHLLEMILLQADVMELRAHPDKLARGTIVEAKLDRGRGPVATVLIQEGVLKVGDPFVCGTEYGRVRALIGTSGNVENALPSTPVEILGLSGVPDAGDQLVVLADEAKARQVAEHRRSKRRETELAKSGSRTTLEDLYQQVQTGEVKELRVIIKADVQGSVEAVSQSLSRLSTNEVKVHILHASVGGVSESDVLLASASEGIILGFAIRPENKAVHLAEREGVEIRLYTVIYELIADIRAALEGLLEPTYREKPLGRAEVRQAFAVSRLGVVAGCAVSEGRMVRGARARLIRDRAVVYEGRIGSLRRFKDDVREVVAGTECGINLENYQDVKAGDIIEVYELEQVLRRLEARPHSQQEMEQRV